MTQQRKNIWILHKSFLKSDISAPPSPSPSPSPSTPFQLVNNKLVMDLNHDQNDRNVPSTNWTELQIGKLSYIA